MSESEFEDFAKLKGVMKDEDSENEEGKLCGRLA